MVFQAYVDESGIGGPVLIMCGYIASVEKWAEFSEEWQELLDMPPRWPYFKMSEIAQSRDELRWERASWFYRVVERHVKAAVCCAVPTAPIERIVSELDLPEILKNPYWFGNKAIINMTAQHQHELGINEPVDFIFDKRSEEARIRNAWDAYIAGIPEETRKLTGNAPIFRDDKEYLPLQAADLYAWWQRRRWEEEGSVLKTEEFPFSWKVERDIRRFIVEFREDDLREELLKIKRLIDEHREGSTVNFRVSYSWNGKPL